MSNPQRTGVLPLGAGPVVVVGPQVLQVAQVGYQEPVCPPVLERGPRLEAVRPVRVQMVEAGPMQPAGGLLLMGANGFSFQTPLQLLVMQHAKCSVFT